MTHEGFESIELGQAEALIDVCWGSTEEVIEKFEPATAPYVEFEALNL